MALRDTTNIPADYTWQKWTGKNQKPHPNRSILETSTDAINNIILTECCFEKCIKQLRYNELKDCRATYWELSGKQQRAFIYNSLRTCTVDGVKFIILNKEVCESAWLSIHGVGNRRYRDIKKSVQMGGTKQIAMDNKRPYRPSRSKLQAQTWLEQYVHLFAERQPDREIFSLPQVLSKEMIYGLYKAEMVNCHEEIISISSFRELWLQTFPNVKISTGKSGQPQCTPCTNIQSLLTVKTLSKTSRNEILEKRTIHLNLQALCRAKYYKHIKKAKEQPERYCSIIIDNMDQAKTKLPVFAIQSKVDAHLTKMQHHVTGVKVHQLEKTIVLTWTDLFHPDANITINSIVYALKEVCKANNGLMPPTLYLQADNSGKDNKNSFLMIFLAWLVKQQIFKKVKIGFLMVGHTHEDIDQVFSRISVHMRKNDAPTLPLLLERIRNSTEKPPVALHLSSIYDYKKELEHCRGLIVGISGPHQFVIKMIAGKVILKYKDWPKIAESYRQIDLTESVERVDFSMLEPVSANPKIEATVEKMSEDLSKWGTNGRLNENDIQWWADYLEQCKDGCQRLPTIPKVSDLDKFGEAQCENHEIEGNTNLRNAVHTAATKQNKVSDLKVRGQKRKRSS